MAHRRSRSLRGSGGGRRAPLFKYSRPTGLALCSTHLSEGIGGEVEFDQVCQTMKGMTINLLQVAAAGRDSLQVGQANGRELTGRQDRDVVGADVEHLSLALDVGGHRSQVLTRAVDRDLGAPPDALALSGTPCLCPWQQVEQG